MNGVRRVSVTMVFNSAIATQEIKFPIFVSYQVIDIEFRNRMVPATLLYVCGNQRYRKSLIYF